MVALIALGPRSARSLWAQLRCRATRARRAPAPGCGAHVAGDRGPLVASHTWPIHRTASQWANSRFADRGTRWRGLPGALRPTGDGRQSPRRVRPVAGQAGNMRLPGSARRANPTLARMTATLARIWAGSPVRVRSESALSARRTWPRDTSRSAALRTPSSVARFAARPRCKHSPRLTVNASTTGRPDDRTTGRPDDRTTGRPDDRTAGQPGNRAIVR